MKNEICIVAPGENVLIIRKDFYEAVMVFLG